MTDIQETLNERGKLYGEFKGHAAVTQELKESMRSHPGWNNLSSSMRETLDMIQHKIGRILNGDPRYPDSWVDIVGYTQLVVNELQGVSNAPRTQQSDTQSLSGGPETRLQPSSQRNDKDDKGTVDVYYRIV